MLCIQKGSLAPALPLVNAEEHVEPRAETEDVNTPRRVPTLRRACESMIEIHKERNSTKGHDFESGRR